MVGAQPEEFLKVSPRVEGRRCCSFVNRNRKCEAILLDLRSKKSGRISRTRCYVHFSVYVCILFRLLLLLLLREVCFTAKACNMLL